MAGGEFVGEREGEGAEHQDVLVLERGEAGEVIIATHPRERTSWLARRMLGHLERELDVPVREIVVADDHDRSPVAPEPPTG